MNIFSTRNQFHQHTRTTFLRKQYERLFFAHKLGRLQTVFVQNSAQIQSKKTLVKLNINFFPNAVCWQTKFGVIDPGSISTTIYTQLLCAQIPKAKKLMA